MTYTMAEPFRIPRLVHRYWIPIEHGHQSSFRWRYSSAAQGRKKPPRTHPSQNTVMTIPILLSRCWIGIGPRDIHNLKLGAIIFMDLPDEKKYSHPGPAYIDRGSLRLAIGKEGREFLQPISNTRNNKHSGTMSSPPLHVNRTSSSGLSRSNGPSLSFVACR
ncbi:uncharacterized protein LOC111519676 isoform X1 [Drosophila willistoni]|uniref:uncharacterized protein LOC111519676 isoform X1 n=1 Tax=Drosophila willistoni TaxID=7260 RepID=UPI001F084FF4|nr:uncharacterized protein LOC111519676 isoform X1 [Drosophila willistoni]